MSRHAADLMRPTKATGKLGELQGNPTTVCKEVPLKKFKPLSGKEQESARQTGADAQYEIEIEGDPNWTELEECYFTGGTIGERRLNIEFVDDDQQNGIKLRLLCGENK